IDTFLESLAQDQGERAIAVILSGAGSDGTLGVRAVKEAGGLTVAQTANGTAPRHAAMPQSAIATGLVDLPLPVEAVPAKLVDYAARFAAASEADDERQAASAKEAREGICEVLRERVGHDFGGYKEKTFLRRVQRRMQVLQLATLDAYVEHLRQDADEAKLLFRDLLIGVTHFFRDADAFQALEQLVVPRLFEGKAAAGTLRVWVPGCSTGEEVYSIALLLRERVDAMRPPPKVQIFGTDIDEAALQYARAGRYPAALLDSVPEERRQRYFHRDGGTLTVAKRVRDLCVFSAHSIVRDPPFSRLDLISCRNLLIYLGSEQQDRVIPVFHFALRPGGFLFLGSAENVSHRGDLFQPLDKKHRLFQRR
ncbi:MAG: chemotaxis protein CheR, partial [Burkholderia sp.]|nr:chemotaxis protein CheR [Burkholderia sp.]